MAESKNPYESPENSELATKGPVADLQYQFDARFMLSLIMATAFLGGLDYAALEVGFFVCLLYTSPSPRDRQKSRMPSSA